MVNDPKRGINRHTESTTNSTANTWDEIFPGNDYRYFMFIQNLDSSTAIDIGYGQAGSEKLLKRVFGEDSLGFSVLEGLPSERIVIRSSGTDIPFVAWES